MKLINDEAIEINLVEGIAKLDELLKRIQLSRDEHIYLAALLAKLAEKVKPQTNQ